MKEKYVTPDLEFESFTLSQSIAAGCDSSTFGAAESWHELGYFAEGTKYAPCTVQWDDTKFEGYCYWQGATKFFTS